MVILKDLVGGANYYGASNRDWTSASVVGYKMENGNLVEVLNKQLGTVGQTDSRYTVNFEVNLKELGGLCKVRFNMWGSTDNGPDTRAYGWWKGLYIGD